MLYIFCPAAVYAAPCEAPSSAFSVGPSAAPAGDTSPSAAIYIHTYIYTYIHTHTHTHMYVYVCIHTHTHTRTHKARESGLTRGFCLRVQVETNSAQWTTHHAKPDLNILSLCHCAHPNPSRLPVSKVSMRYVPPDSNIIGPCPCGQPKPGPPRCLT